MTGEEVKETAQELFTSDPDDILKEQLPRMEGWFDVTGGQIRVNADIDSFSKKQAYLVYLLASYVAYLAEERESPYVSHSEADGFLGWKKGEGRTSEQYASAHSDLLNTESGRKSISPHRLGDVIDLLEEEFDDV